MQQSIALNCLTIICDGMDQAKYRIPRVRERGSKLFKTLFRPTLHCVGTWCHGSRLEFAVSDQDLKKDSQCQLEVINRCLANVYADTNQQFPMGLILQQDNCFREGKNRYLLGFVVLAVALNMFRYAVCNYLRTGHRCLVVSCKGCCCQHDGKTSTLLAHLRP